MGGGCDVGGVCFVPLREGPSSRADAAAVAGFVLRCGANLRCVSVCLIIIMSSERAEGLLPAGPLVEAGRWVGSYQIDSRSSDPPARLSSERSGGSKTVCLK